MVSSSFAETVKKRSLFDSLKPEGKAFGLLCIYRLISTIAKSLTLVPVGPVMIRPLIFSSAW